MKKIVCAILFFSSIVLYSAAFTGRLNLSGYEKKRFISMDNRPLNREDDIAYDSETGTMWQRSSAGKEKKYFGPVKL